MSLTLNDLRIATGPYSQAINGVPSRQGNFDDLIEILKEQGAKVVSSKYLPPDEVVGHNAIPVKRGTYLVLKVEP